MFQRASKKLGLDQAIFLNGSFAKAGVKTEKTVPGNSINIQGKYFSKQEVELLLKKGIVGLIDKKMESEKSRVFKEEDIENILQQRTQMAKFSLIKGSYTLSKE